MDLERERDAGRVLFLAVASLFVLIAGPSVGVRDAGELTTAAALIDVPHPTGFALDMIVLRAAMLVPFGDLAFRANVATGLLVAFTVSVIFHVLCRVTRSVGARPASYAAGVMAAAVIVSSSSVLRASTAVEVYALPMLVTACCLALIVRETTTSATPTTPTGGRDLRVAALLAGATLAMHTNARTPALLALAVLFVRRRGWTRAHGVLPALAALGATGAAVVVYLPAAARRSGPIDWGHPASLGALASHLSAERIRAAFAHRILVPWRVPEDFVRVGRVLVEDLSAWIVALSLVGVIVAVASRHAMRWAALIAVVDVAYAVLINPMGVGDRQALFVGEVCLASLAAWVCVDGPLRAFASMQRRRWTVFVSALVATTLAATAGARSDREYAGRADGWAASELLGGQGALGSVPARAVVLCESDDFCGGSFYAQYVEGERPDVVVVPRQHLTEPHTWNRLRARLGESLDRMPDGSLVPARHGARLRLLVARFRDRIRWEMGEAADEQRARVEIAAGESPVLGVVDGVVRSDDARAIEWIRARAASGIGARRLAAHIAFSVGRRVARADLSAATRYWWQALAWDGDHAAAYTNLGVASARSGNLAQAADWTERALRLDPERLTAWANLGEYSLALGRPERAEQCAREIARRRPRAP